MGDRGEHRGGLGPRGSLFIAGERQHRKSKTGTSMALLPGWIGTRGGRAPVQQGNDELLDVQRRGRLLCFVAVATRRRESSPMPFNREEDKGRG